MIAAAIATVSAVFMVAVVIDLRDLRTHLRSEQFARAALVADVTRDAIAPALWDFDVAQAETLVTAAIGNDLVLSATLRDALGRVLAEGRDNTRPTDGGDILKMRAIRYGEGPNPETIGSLELVFDGRAAEMAVAEATRRRLVGALVAIAALAMALHIVLGHLSRPLARIGQRIGAISRGDLDVAMPYTGRADVIGDLARALETLRAQERELRGMRAASAETTRRERHRSIRALNAMEDAVVVFDEARMVTFVNPAATQLFGNIAVGASFDPTALSCCSAELSRLFDGSRKNGLDLAVACPDGGETRHLHLRGARIQDEYGIILGHVLIATDTTERVRQEERVRYLADHDFLTGLANRRTLERIMAETAERDPPEIAIGLVDLDHFKRINDTLGHAAGDQYLVAVSDRIKNATGENDHGVRLGGDEFAIVCTGVGAAARLEGVMGALLQSIAEPLDIQGTAVSCSLSVGVADNADGQATCDDVMRRADLALYEAKRNGRSRVERFQERLEHDLMRRHAVEQALSKALLADRLTAVFQRQTDVVSGQTVGYEALARWNDDVLGPVSPSEFVPLAEDSGLIEVLTTAMLTRAAHFALKAQALGFAGRVSVNLSPRLFEGRVDRLVLSHLGFMRCPPELIEVEITEHVLMQDRPIVLEQLQRLRDAGVTVGLDDFGVGYSSLSYLQKLPVDKIKVDRSFVQRISSKTTRAIVTTVADLGRALGMPVIAEGAETTEERHVLQLCGVPMIQGWVDGKPSPGREALEDLAQERLVTKAGVPGGDEWYRRLGSNQRPLDPQSSALTN